MSQSSASMSNAGHAKLAAKSAMIRAAFNLPSEQERVVQDYRCSYNGTRAKLYVTQHHVFFYREGKNAEEACIPFRVVCNVKKEGKLLVIQCSGGQEYTFSSFFTAAKRDEAFALCLHLWEEPFSLRVAPPESSSSSAFSRAAPSSSHVAPSPLVDVTSGKAALEKAQRTQEVAASTLLELERQAEKIDAMQFGVARIDAHMDDAARQLRAIESVGGAIANSFSAPPQRASRLIGPRGSVLLRAAEDGPPSSVDVPALWKHPSDALEPCTVRLSTDGFDAVARVGGAVLRKVLYDNVDCLRIRTRPLHMDVLLRDGSERIRVATAALQRLVNELAIRCGRGGRRALPVVFEQEAMEFVFNQEWLRSGGQLREDVNGNNPFAVAGTDYGLSDGADESVRVAFRMQDEQVDAISVAVRQLGRMGEHMGEEVDRQNAQLTQLHAEMDDTNERVRATNARVVRAINNV